MKKWLKKIFKCRHEWFFYEENMVIKRRCRCCGLTQEYLNDNWEEDLAYSLRRDQ